MRRLRFGNWPIMLQVMIGPLLPLVALGFMLWATSSVAARREQTSALVTQTYAVLDAGSELTKLVLDMETGVRGYVLTRDEAFLQPYLDAQELADRQLAELRALLADSPAQQARLDRVAGLIADWDTSAAAPMISRTQLGGDAAEIVRRGEGKRRIDAVRAEMAAFQAEEQRRLTDRLREDEAARALTDRLDGAAVLAAILAFALASYVAWRIVAAVRHLAGAAQQVAAGDLAARVPAGGSNELARTGRAFNAMAVSLTAARDETEAKNRAIQARAVEAEHARGQTRAILDATGEAIILMSPDRRFLAVNRRFGELFGIDGEAVVGRRFDELQDEVGRIFGDAETFRERLAGSAGDAERRFTEIVPQRWPAERELELSSTPVRAGDGAFLGRLYAFRDVTREREVDRMKTEFVSLVSHELWTPLTSIKGYVDLLLDGEVGELTDEQKEFLGVVGNNANRLVALINDLLDVSRIEAGKIELKRVAIDLPRLARGIAESFRPQLEAKGQRLDLALPANLPALLGDPDRVTQILTNLVSNAHKYSPTGGRIAVAAEPEGERVRIDVSDSGIGLSPEEQAQLFTRFYRAKNRTTQEVGGSGPGLSITRSLVQMHGGDVAVTSAPGEGATFSFTLPAVRAPVETDLAAVPLHPGGRILVVDDEPDIAALIRRYLERAGYGVLVAHTAADGLRLAREEQPDLVTLDVMLPDADGFTLLDWLKQDATTTTIPVMMLSVLPDEGDDRRVGAVDYVTKPVREQALLERVGRILGPSERSAPILVADDDADTRRLLAGHLRRAGYDVLEAADGAEAVILARQRAPGLALIDIRMPFMDGVAALRALRANDTTREIPIVMMTASPGAMEETRSAIEALGGSALLNTPHTAEEVAAAIALALPRTREENASPEPTPAAEVSA